MTMTLGQVRDRLRAVDHSGMSGDVCDELADAIDAHMAGMGEPVAHFIETSQGNWEQAADMFRGQPGVRPLYTAPPIDIAAVQALITEMSATGYNVWSEKLEAAIKGASHG